MKIHFLKRFKKTLLPSVVFTLALLIISYSVLPSRSISGVIHNIPNNPHLLSIIISVCLLSVGAILMYLILSSLGKKNQHQSNGFKLKRQILYFICIFLSLISLVPIINYGVIHFYSPQLKQNTYNNLTAISKIQTERINRWMRFREGDAAIIKADEDFALSVNQLLKHQSAEAQQKILKRFELTAHAYRANGIGLIDANKQLLLGTGDTTRERAQESAALVEQAEKTRKVIRSDLFLNSQHHLQIDTVAPIYLPQTRALIGFVVIHSDLYQGILKNLEGTHSGNSSIQSLLVNVNANNILINTGLQNPDAGKLLTSTVSASTAYVDGQPQKIGFDYRGKSIFCIEQPLDSYWTLIVQIDQEEVIAPLRTLLIWISGVAICAIIIIAIALLSLWRQQLKTYQLALKAESTERDRLLKRFYDMPFIGMAVCHPTSKQWINVNDKFCAILDYTTEALLEKTWTEIAHPDDLDLIAQMCAMSQQNASLKTTEEIRFIRKDHQTVLARVDVNCVNNAYNQIELILVSIDDITERKAAEIALKESEERLSLVLKGSNDGWWDIDLNKRKAYHSSSWWSMLGYAAPIPESGIDIWRKLSPVEDIVDIKTFMHQLLNSTQTSYELECKLLHQKGYFVPILTRGFIVRDASGKAVRISGTDTDLTPRIKAAEALRLQEEFNHALLENLSDAVIACDANMKLVLFNQIARQWLNTEVDETHHAQWAEQLGLYDVAGVAPISTEAIPLVQAFNGFYPKDIRLSIKKKHQPLRHVSCSAAPFFDADGQKLGAVVVMRDITSTLSHEKALQEREELYREMFEANPNPMFVYDINTYALLATNDAAITHYGWSRQELSHMSMKDIENSHADDNSHQSAFNGAFQPLQLQHQKKDGTLIDVECSSNPVKFGHKHARLLLVNDVTERKHSEVEIRTANRLLLMLTNINQAIVRRLNTADMFQEACTVAVRDGEFSMAWIGLITPEGNTVNVMARAGQHEDYLRNLHIDLFDLDNHSPTVTALRTGENCICHHIQLDSNVSPWRQSALDNGFKSFVALPLIVNDQVVGNFNLYSSELGIFNSREMKLLDEFAQDISFALTVAEVESEREMAELALRASETLFHTLARSSPVGVFHTNLAGHFLYINQSWFEITGVNLEDSMQDGWLNTVDEIDRPVVKAAWHKAISTQQPFNEEYRFIRADGTVIWVKGQAAPEQDSTGELLGFVGTVTDITAIKINEENHRMSNAVFENTREGIMVTDIENKIVMVNRAFTEITQYQPDEVIGQTPNILASGRHDRDFYNELWKSLETTGHWQGELWNRRKNGDLFPELLSISVIKNEAGNAVNYVGVFADISNLKATEEKLEHLAHHDPLTNLPNRLMLLSRIEHAMSVSKRDGTQSALLMLDLDRFKNVNDNFGHLAGDELLKLVAERLLSKVRDVDTVSRLGGDEFTVLLENISSPEDANRVAMNIIHSIEEPWLLSGNTEVRIGCSIGICIYPGQGETAIALLQHADAALYQAKSSGRGCARFFSEKLTQAARDRFNIETQLRYAIENQELRVYYQPKINIKTGKIIGAEALVRWHHPEDGMILPNAFIGVAEDTGLIRIIGEWVLRETCKQGKLWKESGMPALTLAVNLSAHQLHHTNIVKTVTEVLNESGFPAECLELELTESILMQRETEVIETLNKLGQMGVSLAIDDFGTGYSSLSYLKSFPLDVLKIDRSFVTDIEKDEDDRAITATIIKMAHTLGLQVVAEGVETEEQLHFLTAHQCDMYQGYLLREAVSAEEFTAFLLSNQDEVLMLEE